MRMFTAHYYPGFRTHAWTIGELEASLCEEGVSLEAITEAALILTSVGTRPACDEPTTLAAQDKCDRLNAFLFNPARSEGDIKCLASPVTGGGVNLDRIAQWVACAGTARPTCSLGVDSREILSTQGQALVVEGAIADQRGQFGRAEQTRKAINDEYFLLAHFASFSNRQLVALPRD